MYVYPSIARSILVGLASTRRAKFFATTKVRRRSVLEVPLFIWCFVHRLPRERPNQFIYTLNTRVHRMNDITIERT